MPTGVNSLLQWALPAGWDGARLSQIALQSGETYDGLIGDIVAGLQIVNARLLTTPLFGAMVSENDESTIEYSSGGSTGFQVHSEYAVPDAQRGKTAGHMIPLIPYDRMLGWTWDFLRKARRFQIDNDVASSLHDLEDIWRQQILARFFKSTRTAVGSSGYSYPFADGGTADSTYIPPTKPDRGGSFLSSHNHFLRLNGITQANLETAVLTLWEHGYNAPFDLVVAQADIASWTNTTNVTGYIPRPDTIIRYGSQTDLAEVDQDYIGVVETDYGACRIWPSARVPTKYWGLYKSFGVQDQRNALKVYGSPSYGLRCVLLSGDHIRQYPLENAMLFFEFGVAVGNDRCNGVAVYNHTSGSYTDPTIA